MPESPSHPSTLHEYAGVLRRRKWVVIVATLLVPLAAELAALHATPRYEATAAVLLTQSDTSGILSGTSTSPLRDPERFAKTEAGVARAPEVARRTLAALHLSGRTPDSFLSESSVSPASGADILDFSVTDENPLLASRLVNQYARQFTQFQRQIDLSSITRVRREVEQRLRTLESDGDTRSAIYTALAAKDQQLVTLQALQTDSAFPIRESSSAAKVSPSPIRDGVVAVVFGFLLGAAAAFLWDALDTRVRSASEAALLLHMRLLGRIPKPSRDQRDGVLMVDDSSSAAAEPFRVLRTTLEFAQLDRGARLVMVTSSTEREGKSTTAANLAAALARAGHPVNLVDLDLRQPTVASRFGLRDQPGVTDVALGHVPLSEAMVRIPLTPVGEHAEENGRLPANGNGPRHLAILPAGSPLADPGEFIGSEALRSVLASLGQSDALTLIDSAPLLGVGDSLALTAHVDAVIVVTRVDVARRSMLHEVHRLLADTPVLQLGVVVTGANPNETYDASYTYGVANREVAHLVSRSPGLK